MVGPVVAGDLLNYSESDCEVGGGRWDTDRGREGGGPPGGGREDATTDTETRRHFIQLHLSIRKVKLPVKRYLVECFFLHKYFNCERVGDISC